MKGRGVVLTSWKRKFIGLFWIFSFAAVKSCPDNDNVTMNCDILPVVGLDCSYVKGLPKDPPIDDYKVPTAVNSLDVETGYVSVNNKCETRINITWKVETDGSLDYYRGFYLNISFVYNYATKFLYRTFSVSASNWTVASKTLFRHECVIPARGTEYRIELYSLPMNDRKFHKVAMYHTTSNFTTNTLCDRVGTPANSSTWIATMWTQENSTNGTVEVCFYTAPPSYNFTKYAVSLLPNVYDPLSRVIQQSIVPVDVVKDFKICEKFVNICSGVYKIWVMPMNEPWCTCRLMGECRSSCTATVVDSINMTASVCTSTTVALPTSTTTALPITTAIPISEETPPPIGLSGPKLAGIVVGVLLAVILLVIVAVRLYVGRIRGSGVKRRPSDGGKPGIEPPLPPHAIDDKQTVLLIYSSDNEFHRKVVRNFAAFLHACCKCDVRFDDWSQVDISQTNALDWLTKQLHQVQHIIVINSLGAFMQHKAWIEGTTCKPVKELLLPDMFVPALRQILAQVYSTEPLHYYHVYFPYTDSKHLLDVSFGQRYKLMKHIEDLFLHIHGRTKHSPKGKTSASLINAGGFTSFAEGQALQAAIDEAYACCRRNPNWFSECFNYKAAGTERDVTLVKYSLIDGENHRRSDCQMLTVDMLSEGDFSPPSSKSSDEGLHSDPDAMSPSVEGSCSSELENWRVSLDMGIGNGNDDSSFDPNSPTGFCPPVPDDDEETTSIGSRMFFEKLNELNEQYDSGLPLSSFDFKASDRSSC